MFVGETDQTSGVTTEMKAQNTDGIAGECLKKNLESTVMHGRYIRSVDRQLIGGEER